MTIPLFRIGGVFTALFVLAPWVAAAQQNTACYIYVQGDCHGWVANQTWFADDGNGASENEGACLHRAREYVWWCGLGQPGDQVNAAFNFNNTTVGAQVFQPGVGTGGPTVTTYGVNWTPLTATPTDLVTLGPPPPPPTSTARLNPTAIPLGDQKVVVDGPAWGSIYACDPYMYHQSNGVDLRLPPGPWVNTTAATIDVTSKVVVQGENFFPNASFAIDLTDTQRLITGNGLPVAVPTGNFPTQPQDPAYQYDPNPNALLAQNISFAIPRNPGIVGTDQCIYKEVGFTLDGVILQSGLGDTGRDEIGVTLTDTCGGLTQPGGAYHRHYLSNCTPHMHERVALVGYALDGFGIFSPFDANGTEITSADLDECHGTTSPIPWEGQWVNMYHYVMTRDYPYSVACFKGTPTRNAFPPLPGAPPQTR